MSERWLPIPGRPGYEVSDQGRVISRRRYRGDDGPRFMKQWTNVEGYKFVHISSPVDRVLSVHSLVLLAFAGPRPDGQQVRHLDGDPANNAIGNLRYGTPLENILDQLRHGTQSMARRTHCKHGHEYTPDNTSIWTSSKGRPFRQCKTCHRAKSKTRRSRAAA